MIDPVTTVKRTILNLKTRDSAVLIVARLRAGRPRNLRYPSVAAGLVLLQIDRSESCTHPAFCSMRYGGSLLGSKAVGTWSWPLTSFSAEVKEACNHTCTSKKAFIVCTGTSLCAFGRGPTGAHRISKTQIAVSALIAANKTVPSKLNFRQYVCFLHRGCRCSYGTFPTAGLISVRN